MLTLYNTANCIVFLSYPIGHFQVYYLPPSQMFSIEVGDMLGVHVTTGFVPLYYEVTSNPATTQGLCDLTNDPMGDVIGYNLTHSGIISGGSTVNIRSKVTSPRRISMIQIFQRGTLTSSTVLCQNL